MKKRNTENMTYVESVQDTHPIDVVKKAHNSGRAWYQFKAPSWIMTAIMSLLDFLVLYMITDNAVKQADWQSWVLAIGLAIALNFLPLFIAKSVQDYQYGFNPERAKKVIIISLAAYAALYIGTLITRFAFFDIFLDSTPADQLHNALDTGAVQSTGGGVTAADNWKAVAFTILTAVSPLVTSAINGLLCYFTENGKKAKLRQKEERKQEILAELARIEVGIANLERDKEALLAGDDGRYEAAKQIVHYKCEALRAKALFMLAEHVGNADGISKVSDAAASGANAAMLPEVVITGPDLTDSADSEEKQPVHSPSNTTFVA